MVATDSFSKTEISVGPFPPCPLVRVRWAISGNQRLKLELMEQWSVGVMEEWENQRPEDRRNIAAFLQQVPVPAHDALCVCISGTRKEQLGWGS